MPIDQSYARGLAGMQLTSASIAGWIVAAAMTLSTIVFSEPAIADAMMIGVIVAVPALGTARFGKAALLNMAAWLVIVALGLAGTMLSTNFDTGFKHQLVTLFLAVGSFVLSGYVSADPEPRFNLIMWCYAGACLIATLAAFTGYFHILPDAYDLFTNYGRARGTFKDPNVYGAALAPALTFAVWVMLRQPAKRVWVAALLAMPLALGLLISFSRGAWISAAISIAMLLWLALVRSRRQQDFRRLGLLGLIGGLSFIAVLFAALQIDQVKVLLDERASMDQSYDVGPDGRFGGQEKARALILAHPFGIGTHTFRDSYHHEEPHNVYLSMFLNAGWLGGLAYIFSIVFTLSIGLKTAFRHGALQGPLIVASSAFAGVAFEGFVIDSDHWRHVFMLMALIWGLVDAGDVHLNPQRRRDD